jgi:hypothetical protein
MAIDARFVAVALFVVPACGGSNGAAPSTRPPETTISTDSERGPTPPPSANKGSSDGKTCEEARESYSDDVNIGGGAGQADLTERDFAAVLNNGTYLESCGLPNTSKLHICAAIQHGQAVGVTVAAEPPLPDVEVCVAKEVRKLSFPSHIKMDIVSVQF